MSTTTIQRVFNVGTPSVPTDADAVPTLQSDVTRTDTGAIVLPQSTAFTRTATGTYALPTFTDPAPNLTYAYTVQFVYQSVAYTISATSRGGGSTNAAIMVPLLEQALRDNPIGLVTVTVDGQTTTWSRTQALAELKYWQQQLATEQGRRPRASRINLSNF
jgi:hypothetical protein